MSVLLVATLAVSFAACNKTNNKATVTGFTIYLDGVAYSGENNTIDITYGDNINVDEIIAVKIKYSDNTEAAATKGDGGYTLTGLPTNADGYNINVKYGDYGEVTVKLIVKKNNWPHLP